jgi:serine phosphatase RsbU (regulator of sigma subunit)/catechol 2,3-dioxygenase-like lactoylglutathione lyase family enzyme
MAVLPIPTPADSFLSIHAVRVYVRDVDRSLKFYVEKLGFRLVIDTKLQSGERWVAVSPPDGTTIIALVAPKPKTVEAKLIGRSTQVVLVTSDVTRQFREWSERGVRFLSTPRLRRVKYQKAAETEKDGGSRLLGRETPVWGTASARFCDPDGNAFSLVSFDELTHAVETERREAAAKVEAERRILQEMEIATQVQSRLFPQTQPRMNWLEYAGACIPARAVGGDYFDFLQLGPDRLGLVVADVAGKGIAAALLMANLQANLRSQFVLALEQPERLLQKVNRLFCENTPDGTFATLFFADYDDSSGYLRYVNCGHLCGLLVRRDGSVERLASTCTVLGIFKTWQCVVSESALRPGDLLALYTDGVTESMDHALDEYGEERFIESLRRHRQLSPDALVTSLVTDVRAFSPHEQRDDITLIVAKRRDSVGASV